MSEYIEIETEVDEETPFTIHFFTNLLLTRSDSTERYESTLELAEGSPLAQALLPIMGIETCEIERSTLTIQHDPNVPEYAIVADVSAAIKDFFL
ncbi:MAG: hypothetical protein AAF633_18315 [Chloroflexota bacterium]